MILTGKAQQYFIEWYKATKSKNINLKDFSLNIAQSISYAIVIEWFDSVCIYINIKSKFGQRKQCEIFSFTVKTYNSGFIFNSRKEATKEAIQKACYFYNRK